MRKRTGRSSGRSTLRTLFVLLGALLSGGVAGYAALQLMSNRTPPLPDTRTILTVSGEARGLALGLSDDVTMFVDTIDVPSNARNIALFYPGKTVTIVPDGKIAGWPSSRPGCRWIVPLFQEAPREIGVAEYEHLRSLGFTRRDLGYSYAIPRDVAEADTDSVGFAGDPVYPALSLCGTE